MGLFSTGLSYLGQRAKAVAFRRGSVYMSGLRGFASGIKDELFTRRQTGGPRIAVLTFNFNNAAVAETGRGIPPAICRAMRAAGVESVKFKANIEEIGDNDFPHGRMEEAVKSALRHLSLYGLPKDGERIEFDLDASYFDDRFGENIYFRGRATLLRISPNEAVILFKSSTMNTPERWSERRI